MPAYVETGFADAPRPDALVHPAVSERQKEHPPESARRHHAGAPPLALSGSNAHDLMRMLQADPYTIAMEMGFEDYEIAAQANTIMTFRCYAKCSNHSSTSPSN